MARLLNHRLIPLGGKHGGLALVDRADYPEVARHRWTSMISASGTLYAGRTTERAGGKRCLVLMHIQIMGVKGIDHHNRNGLDNRRHNLRPCTQHQNCGNQRRAVNNTSGVKGVSWQKKRRRWQAQIRVHGRDIFLGRFHERDEAAAAYARAATEHFGEFARVE